MPEEMASDWDDEEFLAELDRRAGDLEGAVPAAELWNDEHLAAPRRGIVKLKERA